MGRKQVGMGKVLKAGEETKDMALDRFFGGNYLAPTQHCPDSSTELKLVFQHYIGAYAAHHQWMQLYCCLHDDCNCGKWSAIRVLHPVTSAPATAPEKQPANLFAFSLDEEEGEEGGSLLSFMKDLSIQPLDAQPSEPAKGSQGKESEVEVEISYRGNEWKKARKAKITLERKARAKGKEERQDGSIKMESSWSGESYEATDPSLKPYLKLQKLLKDHSDQCMRILCENEPLFPLEEEISPCGACGHSPVLYLQVLPTLNNDMMQVIDDPMAMLLNNRWEFTLLSCYLCVQPDCIPSTPTAPIQLVRFNGD